MQIETPYVLDRALAAAGELPDPKGEYARRLSDRQAAARRLHRMHIWMGNAQVALFLAIVALGWNMARAGAPLLYWLAATIAAFAGLAVIHGRVVKARQRADRAAEFYRRGLARVEDRWAGMGDPGNDFLDPDHVYAEDLDIVGEGSLFQLLCTARTHMGKEQLARWLLFQSSLLEVKERQQAVKELCSRIDLREELALAGKSDQIQADPERLARWADQRIKLQYRRWWPWVLLLSLLASAAVVYGFIAQTLRPPLWAALVNAIMALTLRRPLQLLFANLSEMGRNLEGVSAIVRCLEGQQFQAPLLRELQQQLMTEGRKASECIAGLSTLCDLEESRSNMIVRLLDLFVLYSLHLGMALQRWRERYAPHIETWLNTVGEFEALISLSAYAYEHPDDVFPEFAEAAAVASLAGESLGHPLLPAEKCVRNSVTLAGPSQILLVSGSNMSGKSTLLRVVGINTVLAMAGSPVRASRLRFSPVVIGASMRISDSLQKGVSHFYAEISRIRDVVALSQRGPLLFLFDEILQGTNSRDRRVGAEGVLRTLIQHGAIGMVTTHDLALTAVAEVFPGQVKNVHFQEKLEAGKLSFDYRLREGVVTTSNGVELMKSIGLDV